MQKNHSVEKLLHCWIIQKGGVWSFFHPKNVWAETMSYVNYFGKSIGNSQENTASHCVPVWWERPRRRKKREKLIFHTEWVRGGAELDTASSRGKEALPQYKSFLSLSRWRDRQTDRQKDREGWDLLHLEENPSFCPALASCPSCSCACVCEGVCRKEMGKLSPSLDKGRRWLALLSFGVGWCKQTLVTERRALPWSSFQFPAERDGRQGGPAYNKKGLETLTPLPPQHPDTPSPLAHDPCSSPGHMHSYQGRRNAKNETGHMKQDRLRNCLIFF